MIEMLRSNGYKYMFVLKGARKCFYATKAEIGSASEPFTDDTEFSVFSVENDEEKAMLKALPKNTFIKL